MISEIKYSNTNTYLIRGKNGDLLFDTGWAGTFGAFCKALGEKDLKLQNIKYLLISHFHPDHMGIAQEIIAKDMEPLNIRKIILHVRKENARAISCYKKSGFIISDEYISPNNISVYEMTFEK